MSQAGETRTGGSRRPDRGSRLLTVNGGSSSLKFALFTRGDEPSRLASGKVERLGTPAARFSAKGSLIEGGREEGAVDAGSPADAAQWLLGWVETHAGLSSVGAVGHRVVHGGPNHFAPERVTPALLDDLKAVSPFDPDHLPAEVAMIEVVGKAEPSLAQVACFDTAFHRDLPTVAKLLPIPRRYESRGVRRYGFHGLSYEYLLGELRRLGEGGGRVVMAHLGSGASVAAVRGGACVDTSMAFTPTAGLVMGTRTGDLDPGLVDYFARTEGMTAGGFHTMVNAESGLLGVSETSADVRDLVKARGSDRRAAEALDLFGYTVKKWVGAYAAALGGLDTLVFSGGIGENSPEVRAAVCDGLGFLGLAVDGGRNASSAPLISTDEARVRVRVIPTDEELTIARAVGRLLGHGPTHQV